MPVIESSGWLNSIYDKLEGQLEDLEKHQLEYGYYPEDHHYGADMSMGSLALIHERGSEERNIPARPFVLYSAYLIDSKDKNIFSRTFINYIYKKRGEGELRKLGRQAVKAIGRSIDEQNFEPLKPETVQKKGSSVILIDTQELFNGARYKIVKPEVNSSVD